MFKWKDISISIKPDAERILNTYFAQIENILRNNDFSEEKILKIFIDLEEHIKDFMAEKNIQFISVNECNEIKNLIGSPEDFEDYLDDSPLEINEFIQRKSTQPESIMSLIFEPSRFLNMQLHLLIFLIVNGLFFATNILLYFFLIFDSSFKSKFLVFYFIVFGLFILVAGLLSVLNPNKISTKNNYLYIVGSNMLSIGLILTLVILTQVLIIMNNYSPIFIQNVIYPSDIMLIIIIILLLIISYRIQRPRLLKEFNQINFPEISIRIISLSLPITFIVFILSLLLIPPYSSDIIISEIIFVVITFQIILLGILYLKSLKLLD